MISPPDSTRTSDYKPQLPKMTSSLKQDTVSLSARTTPMDNDFKRDGSLVDSQKPYRPDGTTVRFEPIVSVEQMLTNETTKVESDCHVSDAFDTMTDKAQFKYEVGMCGLIVHHYRTAFAVTFSIEMFAVLLTGILLLKKDYQLFPLDFHGLPAKLSSDTTNLRFMAFEDVHSHHDMMYAESDKITLLPRASVMDYLELVYEGENVLTKTCLNAIQEIENWLTNSTAWNDWCLVNSHGHKLKPTSLLRYLDGSISADLNDPNMNNISKTISDAYSRNSLQDNINKLIHKKAIISPMYLKSKLTRSVFYIGIRDSNQNKVTDFWVTNFQDKLEDLATNGRAGMNIYFHNNLLLLKDVTAQVNTDFMLAVGSFIFIVLFVMIQTQSIFITVTGIGSIITSFLWTNIIYRVVLDYRYFGILHVLSVFVILGIGADDLFVFYDMWRTTAFMDLNTVRKRFSFCYRHASLSMLVTSVTTAFAFVSNTFTTLYAIRTFALFSAMLVMINYLSAIFFFPTCVLLYHKDIETIQWPWSKFLSQTDEDDSLKQPNFVIRFLKSHFHKMITHHVFKWMFIASSTVTAVIFAFLANQLQISKKEVQYYRTGFNYQDVAMLRRYSFFDTLEDPRINVYILFGIKENDMSTCLIYDYECRGKFNYDDRLDMNPVSTQKALLKLCDELKNITSIDDLHVYKDENTGFAHVVCFLESMNTFFLEYSKNMSMAGQNLQLSIPITALTYSQLAKNRTDLYGDKIWSRDFYRFFETAVSFWLTNGYRVNDIGEYDYTSDVYLSKNLGLSPQSEDVAMVLSDQMSLYGTRLRFIEIKLMTELFMGTTDYKTGLRACNAWETLTNKLMASLPPSAQGFQVSTKNEWHDFKVSENLYESAFRGIMLGAIMAFIVLCVATSNVIISALATINILLVVATFAGCIQLFGWSISVVESINLSLVTGLSVDYVVHFSESYHQAPHESRKRKVRDMLEHMGMSILSGAATTAGAAMFMLLAKIHFFFQFGVFIVVTILFSVFYSFFWFTPLLSVFGPEGDTGSLIPVYRWMWQTACALMAGWEETCDEHRKLSYSRSLHTVSFMDDTIESLQSEEETNETINT